MGEIKWKLGNVPTERRWMAMCTGARWLQIEAKEIWIMLAIIKTRLSDCESLII